MNIKIIYNNKAEPGFESGWGFSCILELEEQNILFDTGWDGKTLLSNMEKLGISPEEIDKVILSHYHWDHTGGLGAIRRKSMDVYVPEPLADLIEEESSNRYNLHSIKNSQQIADGIWTTGLLGDEVKEQSLVVRTEEGFLVVVGCSHPGVKNILEAAGEIGNVMGIVGGLHGFDEYEVLEDLDLIVSTHCTENEDEIRDIYQEKYVEGKVGWEMSFQR